MKLLVWIDDDAHVMLPVVQNWFPTLWDEEIACKILFFGDAYQDYGGSKRSQADADNFTRDMNELYEDYLRTRKRKGLALPPKDLCTEDSTEVVPELTCDALIEKLAELKDNDSNQVGVALDVVLRRGDYERLAPPIDQTTKEALKKPDEILSMDIYHALTRKPRPGEEEHQRYQCAVYSTFTFSETFKGNWTRIYKEKHGDDAPAIIPRTFLNTRPIDRGILDEFLGLFREEVPENEN